MYSIHFTFGGSLSRRNFILLGIDILCIPEPELGLFPKECVKADDDDSKQ